MGLRSQIEAGLGDERGRFDLDPMPLPGLRLTGWPIGAAVRENARDLGYAAGDILVGRRPRRHHGPHLPGPRRRLPATTVRLTPMTTTLLQLRGRRGSDFLDTRITQGDSIMTDTSSHRHAARAAATGTAMPALAVTDQDLLKDDQSTGRRADLRHGLQGAALQPARQDQQGQRQAAGAGLDALLRRREAARPGEPADRLRRHDLRHRLLLAPLRGRARTGKEKWQYDARLPEGILPCCDVVNRGAAIYGDKIYFTTLDAQLVALTTRPARSSGARRWTSTRTATPTPPHR